jgi:hypothetical protein
MVQHGLQPKHFFQLHFTGHPAEFVLHQSAHSSSELAAVSPSEVAAAAAVHSLQP